MKQTSLLVRHCFIVLCCVFLLCSNALTQEISGTNAYPRNPDQIKTLLETLENPDMDRFIEIQKKFFGENSLYDKELANLFIFINKTKRDGNLHAQNSSQSKNNAEDNSVRFALIKGDKKRSDLFGEKFVHIMVFVAENSADKNSVKDTIPESVSSETIKGKPTEDTLVITSDEITKEIKQRSRLFVHQSSLDYTEGSGEFFLISMVKSIARVFSGASLDLPGRGGDIIKEIDDTPLKMQKVGSYLEKDLFFGYLRVRLYENTINRFTINEDYPDSEAYPDRSYFHMATLGNYSGSRIGSSIGFGGTFLKYSQYEKVGDKYIPVDDKRTHVNAFFFGHVYLKRPKLPTPHYLNSSFFGQLWKRASISAVCGTKISTALFEDLFVGVGVGHIYSTVGIVVGCDFQTESIRTDNLIKKNRKCGFCAGIAFAL